MYEEIENKSLNELTELADNIIKNLEKQKDLEKSIEEYKDLIKLNSLIEKKFNIVSKQITQKTKEKISKKINITNDKKVK